MSTYTYVPLVLGTNIGLIFLENKMLGGYSPELSLEVKLPPSQSTKAIWFGKKCSGKKVEDLMESNTANLLSRKRFMIV